MNTEWETVYRWVAEGHRCALATVVQTWGSGPRPVGSVMGIRKDLVICGSVSGGCVENAVIDEALQVLITGQPVVVDYGIGDDTAWAVGLSCGGALKVYIEPFIGCHREPEEQEISRLFEQALKEHQPVALITDIKTAHHRLLKTNADFSKLTSIAGYQGEIDGYEQEILALFKAGQSVLLHLAGAPSFVHLIIPPPVVVIIGAAHITLDVVKVARFLGFVTIVIDPRAIFADKERFGDYTPDKLYTQYPDECLPEILHRQEVYAMTLSHDPKIDDPALQILLRSKVVYIGALGSKKTHQKRLERLREAGFDEQSLNRISAPIGLDIHAVSPAEIALSIMAEITALRRKVQQ